MSENRKDSWLIVTLAVFILFLVINRMIFTRQAFPVWDADNQAAPWQMLVADHARAGQFLLWNPWTTCGSPDFAEPQVGAFSPVTFFLGLMTGGVYSGFIVYWLSIWLLGGLGIIILAKHLRAPPWGGFVAAIAFLFSGFYTGHAQHLSHLHAISWVPWIIWRLDVGLKEKRVVPAIQAGALWGLSALAGYPGLVMLSGGYAFVWTLGRFLFGWPESDNQTKQRTGLKISIVNLCLFGAVGLIVLLPTYAGFMMECQGFSDRVGQLSREMSLTNSLHPGALSTFASPYITTLCMYNQPMWSYTDPSSISIYVGPLVTCLALFSIAAKPKDGWRWWLAGTGVLCILIALARVLPFHGLLYSSFPPARFFRHPAIYRDFAIFSSIILAITGSRQLAELMKKQQPRNDKTLVLICVISAICAAATYTLIATGVKNPGDQPLLATIHIVTGWGGMCFVALLAIKQRSTALRPQLVLQLLMALTVCDACFALTLTHDTVFSRDPALKRDWRYIDSHHEPDLDLTVNKMGRIPASGLGMGPSNKNLPGKIPVFKGYTAMKNRFHEAWGAERKLTAFAVRRDRVWFATDSTILTPSMPAFQAFKDRALREDALPMLIHEPDSLRKPPPYIISLASITNAPLASKIDVNLVSYKPNLLHIKTDCPSDGWLLVTDRWAPGWRATINGRSVKVWGGTFIFRALEVKKGMNEIVFSYHPFGYPWLLIISWSILALILGFSLYSAIRRTPSSMGAKGTSCGPADPSAEQLKSDPSSAMP